MLRLLKARPSLPWVGARARRTGPLSWPSATCTLSPPFKPLPLCPTPPLPPAHGAHSLSSTPPPLPPCTTHFLPHGNGSCGRPLLLGADTPPLVPASPSLYSRFSTDYKHVRWRPRPEGPGTSSMHSVSSQSPVDVEKDAEGKSTDSKKKKDLSGLGIGNLEHGSEFEILGTVARSLWPDDLKLR